jgi:hypothetical protein
MNPLRNRSVTYAFLSLGAALLAALPARAAQEIKKPIDPLEAQESRLDAALRDLRSPAPASAKPAPC